MLGKSFEGQVDASRRAFAVERASSPLEPSGPANTPKPGPPPGLDGSYALATGSAAAYRLRILHSVYGPGTRRVLANAGLRRGMRVADLGCGVGLVTTLLADLVGPKGLAVGVDNSAEQLALARAQTEDGRSNTCFFEASATGTGLPREAFDLVYCRFLLMHLPEPEQALREIFELLSPGGILVCEDGDLTTSGSQPPSALGVFADLWGRLGPSRGVDYTLGSRLFRMVIDAGFESAEITFNQPVVARGENKALLELSVAEAGPAFVAAGLVTADELDRMLGEMRQATADENVLAVMPRMSQIWARKPRPGLQG